MSAGYSGTPQARKLGLSAGQRVAIDGAPFSWGLTEPPVDLVYVQVGQPADVVLSFYRSAEDLAARLPAVVDSIFPDGGLWIAWPRKAGGHQSDLTDNVIRAHALPLGIVDVKVAAIDADWSGQRFVWRVANRAGRGGSASRP